jgi:predicted nucleic acid-binding protein
MARASVRRDTEPGPRHLDLLGSLLEPQPSVRLVTDAHLAAIAIEHGLELTSRDRDFARWSHLGLRSRDPLA